MKPTNLGIESYIPVFFPCFKTGRTFCVIENIGDEFGTVSDHYVSCILNGVDC